MSTALLVTTTPREIEPRWVRSNDQVAVFATHYDPAQAVTLIRTQALAMLTDRVEWWSVTADPEHVTPVAGISEVFRLTIAPAGGAPAVEIVVREHEQLVIREAVTLEPWDLECHGLEGACYLPTGHPGPCDSDRNPAVTPERDPVARAWIDDNRPRCVSALHLGHTGGQCPHCGTRDVIAVTFVQRCVPSKHVPAEGYQCSECAALDVVFDDDDPAGWEA